MASLDTNGVGESSVMPYVKLDYRDGRYFLVEVDEHHELRNEGWVPRDKPIGQTAFIPDDVFAAYVAHLAQDGVFQMLFRTLDNAKDTR
jgi:hypothetical protein